MMVVVGLFSLNNLGLREYPKVSVPIIRVNTNFPNASAQLVEQSVTNILENKLAGIENLEMVESESFFGRSQITLTFKEGSSIDQALLLSRDAISSVKNSLPEHVFEPTIERHNTTDGGVPFLGILLTNPHKDLGELTHEANRYFINFFKSIEGVADVAVWGSPYTMEVSIDHKSLTSYQMNACDVYDALSLYTKDIGVGKYQERFPAMLQIPLSSPKDFEKIPVKISDKTPILLKDIADINLVPVTKYSRLYVNGNPSVLLNIIPTTDANPIEVSKNIHARIRELSGFDTKLEVVIDQSKFIKSSLKNLQWSILESIILVLLIVYATLRRVCASLIPLITIPVSLIGGLYLLYLFNFSINTMTLLAMVLAIGLVVDDAIIVLENIERYIQKGLSPYEASLKGGSEIAFPIISMTFTLASVYVPIGFLKGAIGQIFKEFAMMLSGSVVISGVVALTLSPLMCSYFLKPHKSVVNTYKKPSNIMRCYQLLLERTLVTKGIFWGVGIMMMGLGIIVAMMPKALTPSEDRSLCGIYVPPIDGQNIEDVDKRTNILDKGLPSFEGVDNRITFLGDWGASICFGLSPHEKRRKSSKEIHGKLQEHAFTLPFQAFVWSVDNALPGITNTWGSDEVVMVLSTHNDLQSLSIETDNLLKKLRSHPHIKDVRKDLRLDSKMCDVVLDKDIMNSLNISLIDVSRSLEIFLSGNEHLPFKKDDFLYNITIKTKTSFNDLYDIHFKTKEGNFVPFGIFASLKNKGSAKKITHFNQMRCSYINMTLSHGASLHEIGNFVKNNIPNNTKSAWTGLAKADLESGNTMLILIVMALICIYGILAIQFGSFIDPLIILTTVPLAGFGALITSFMMGESLNIYVYVGLMTLIGLITKHGILMVEFANQLQALGKTWQEAITQSALIRFRPIVMTTSAMALGAVPLIIGHSAGSEARFSIGLVLVSGLVFGTCLTLLILPRIYMMVKAYS